MGRIKGKNQPTMKQTAYARRLLGAQGKNKKQIALDVGYSPYVANSVSSHIENKPGFHAAMAALAHKSGNIAMEAMEELQRRGFKDFTNAELTNALNAIGGAWARFNAPMMDAPRDNGGNKLRAIILQQVENQTVNAGLQAPEVKEATPIIETTSNESPSVL